MRSEKYANILNDEEETYKNDDLGMTREIKYKDIQEGIDMEDTEPTKEIQVQNAIIEQEKAKIIKENEEKLMKTDDMFLDVLNTKDKQKNNVPETTEELSLTNSFKKVKPTKNIKGIIFRLLVKIILIISISSLGYFIIYPEIVKYLFVTPKTIFDDSIDYIADSLINNLNSNDNNTNYTDFNFNIDSNIDTFKGLSQYTYGISSGYNLENKYTENMYYIKDNDTKYGITKYNKDNKLYINYSTSNKILELGENTNYEDIENQLGHINTVFNKNLYYIINKERIILKELIQEENLSYTDDIFEVNGKKVNVRKNTFSLKKDELTEFYKNNQNMLLDDTEFITNIESLFDVSANEAKEIITELLSPDESVDTLNINIYTNKLFKVVGIDIEENGFRDFYYYTDTDNNFNIYLNLSSTLCKKDIDCSINNQNIIEAIGIKKDNNTEIKIKYNYKEIGTINLIDNTSDKLNFDYEIKIDEEIYTGNVTIDKLDKRHDINLNIKNNTEYINIKINITNSTEFQLTNFTNKEIVHDANINEEEQQFINILKENGIYEHYNLFSLISDENQEGIEIDANYDNNEEDESTLV